MVVRLPIRWDSPSPFAIEPDAPRTLHVVDDDRTVCAIVARVFENLPCTVQTHGSSEQFLEHYDPLLPHGLVLDLQLPGMSGLELLADLRQRQVLLPTLVLSANSETANVVQSIQRGAVDFLPKPPDRDALLAAAQLLLERSSAFAAERRLLNHLRACFERLTPREQEVFELLTQGESPKQIATTLGLRPRTAHIHRANVLAKFHAESTHDMVLIGARLRNGQFGEVTPFTLRT